MNALKPAFTTNVDCQINCARFSPDGAVLAAGGVDGTIRRWKLSEKKLEPLPPLTGHHGWLSTLAFHPKKPWLYTADSWGRLRCQTFAEEQAPITWELETAHDGWIRQVRVSPDGTQIATCGRDGFLKLWTAEGKPVAEFKHDDDIYVVTFSPDGAQLVFGDLHGHLVVWDIATKKVVRKMDATIMYKLDRLQDLGGLRLLAFSPDAQHLYAIGTTPANGATTQSTPTLLTFDFVSGKQLHKFNYGAIKDGAIEDLAVHSSGELFGVTNGDPGTGRLLRFRPDQKEPADATVTLANCVAIAMHPSEERFVVISTNPGSNGNGKKLEKDGSYACNSAPLSLFELPAAEKAAALDAVIDAKVPK